MYHWALGRSEKFHFDQFENYGGSLPYNSVAGHIKPFAEKTRTFFCYFFDWVPIFDPTLVQNFIQIPICFFIARYQHIIKDDLGKKIPHFRGEYLFVSCYLNSLLSAICEHSPNQGKWLPLSLHYRSHLAHVLMLRQTLTCSQHILDFKKYNNKSHASGVNLC